MRKKGVRRPLPSLISSNWPSVSLCGTDGCILLLFFPRSQSGRLTFFLPAYIKLGLVLQNINHTVGVQVAYSYL